MSAPIAGRLADRGLTRPGTGCALIAALLLDAAVQMCQVLSLRSIYMLAPDTRGRLNGLYMAFVFACGATGSALAAVVYVFLSWHALATLGACFVGVALVWHIGEFRCERRGWRAELLAAWCSSIPKNS
jgi:predicted MFS family arabinose efflux permease